MVSSPHSHSIRFFAGVDGGGSSTRVVIASEDGRSCGVGHAAGCNPFHRGATKASEALQAAFEAAWADARLTPQPISSAFFGVAGLGAFRKTHPPDTLISWLPRRDGAEIGFDHDLRTALAGGLEGRPGIVVIAGTGSSGYGRTGAGRTAQASGWGALLDDRGSGYWLGLQALVAVTRAADGRGPKTELTQRVLAAIGGSDPTEVLSWIRIEPDRRVDIAALAPLVFAAAQAGDEEAQKLLRIGADELAQIAQAVAGAVFLDENADVVFTGGLSQNGEYRRLLATALQRRTPQLQLRSPTHSPVVGALLLAFEAAQVTPTAELLRAADLKVPA